MSAMISRHFIRIELLFKSAFQVRNNSSIARVAVQQGELQGKLEKLSSGNTFASFKGIPYATPPVGKLRFKAPLPPVKWQGVRLATEHGQICPQHHSVTGKTIEGSEDCLFLNIYSPNIEDQSTPVMVWFHGGGFIFGSGNSDLYGPDHFVEEGVILVTVNFRLEALGFLCLDTPDVPGNAGLKDQVAALKWIKENISQFGGDPNNITVFGESSGGACATYHMVSPMSKGLINKVICQSSCFFNFWTLCHRVKERSFHLGKIFGKETTNATELLDFFQDLPAVKFAKVTQATMSDEEKCRDVPIHFGPIVEKDFNNQECFLPKPVKQLLVENGAPQIPILLGYSNKEGLGFYTDALKNAKALETNFERKIHKSIIENVTEEELKAIVDKVKHFYFGNKEINKETSSGLIDLESDYNFSVGVMELAQKLGQISPAPVYLYRLSVDTELNIFKHILGLSKFKGTCHGDSIYYLFKTAKEVQKGSDAWRALKRTVRLWTNFAKYGDPTPKKDELIDVVWKPVTKTSLNFLDIGYELTPGQDPDKERFDLWMNIYNSVNKKEKTA